MTLGPLWRISPVRMRDVCGACGFEMLPGETVALFANGALLRCERCARAGGFEPDEAELADERANRAAELAARVPDGTAVGTLGNGRTARGEAYRQPVRGSGGLFDQKNAAANDREE